MPWEIRLIRAVAGILYRENKILIAERPVGRPYSGYWEFPGGKIEVNESGEEALKRELAEELGIMVMSAQRWFEHSHVYPDKTVFLEMWLVKEFSGVPEGKEKQMLRWVTMSELVGLRVLEGNLAIIDRINPAACGRTLAMGFPKGRSGSSPLG